MQVQREDARAIEPAQSAMEVADLQVEEQPADEAQDRVAEIAMQQRHCARGYTAAKPGDEIIETGKVIAVVRIADDDVAPVRRADAGAQRRAVAALVDTHGAS